MHGGLRPGAGRPAGGLSQTRRLLVNALTRGLAIAGRAKGLAGDDEEVATESAARIAADLILAGRGDEVLKLLAVATPASDPAGGERAKSPLLAALERLPGMQNSGAPVPGASEATAPGAPGAVSAEAQPPRPSDPQSEGRDFRPFFLPQLPLATIADDAALTPPHTHLASSAAEASAGATQTSDAYGHVGARTGAAPGAGTPYPPLPARAPTLPLSAENFENFSSEGAR